MTMPGAWSVAVVLCVCAALAAAQQPAKRLNQYPFVQAHDSASGYLPHGGVVDHQLFRWTKTQPGGVGMQLGCGARALDWRPAVSNGQLVMHHGDVIINHTMASAVAEMVEWAGNNTDPADLLLVYMWDCQGDGCEDMAVDTFRQAGIHGIVSNCTDMAALTMPRALELATLASGGHILVITGCVDQHYDQTMTCSGNQGIHEYTCYADSSSKAYPINRIFKYFGGVADAAPPTDGTLVEMQAIWQESAETVAIGELHDSSLLLDEQKSGLNALVTKAVLANQFEHLNLVLVNNVCDGGPALLAALRNWSGHV